VLNENNLYIKNLPKLTEQEVERRLEGTIFNNHYKI